MKFIKKNSSIEKYEKELEEYHNEFSEFIEIEKNIIKNLSYEEISETRRQMEEDIKEIKETKIRRNVEFSLLVFLTVYSFVCLHGLFFFICLIPIVFLTVMLYKTLRKIQALNHSILMFYDEIEMIDNR